MARRPGGRLLRLLLDEHLSPEIARQLRARGHDVVGVGERADLVGREDRVHFASVREERRAIVTVDVGDFRPLLAMAMRSGARTYGFVCVPRRLASRQHIGAVVDALDRLLAENPHDEDLADRGGEIWLQAP